MSPTHILFEFASGYALFEKLQLDEIGQELSQVQDALLDLDRFSRSLKLKSFFPFKSAAHALENINEVSEGVASDYLKEFVQMNLASTKKSRVVLGVCDKNLAGSIKAATGVECESGSEIVNEAIRAIRFHAHKTMTAFKTGDFEKAQLGLGHSYSRAKVKFNVNRSDNMIIQSICLLDQLDKDINTFSMRVREWYSWHFPELSKIVTDHFNYAKAVLEIKNKADLSAESLDDLEACLGEEGSKAPLIVEAAKASMGTEISPLDMLNIANFAARVVSLSSYRAELSEYLRDKMSVVAPNLASLIGDVVGARLIARAGSLTNLSKAPASTVQILGAEKALFRALKTKGKTPKYGIIYHSTFIGRAGAGNKGRISRYLANKCSIASRIDCFTDVPSTVFGEAMKSLVEERIKFYESGQCPRTNVEVMSEAAAKVPAEDSCVTQKKRKNDSEASDSKKKSKKASDEDAESSSSKKEKSSHKAVAATAEAPATKATNVSSKDTSSSKSSSLSKSSSKDSSKKEASSIKSEEDLKKESKKSKESKKESTSKPEKDSKKSSESSKDLKESKKDSKKSSESSEDLKESKKDSKKSSESSKDLKESKKDSKKSSESSKDLKESKKDSSKTLDSGKEAKKEKKSKSDDSSSKKEKSADKKDQKKDKKK